MEVSIAIRPSVLLKSSPAGIRDHLHGLIRDGDHSPVRIRTINRELLHLIDSESIPSIIYAFWLPLALEYNVVEFLPAALRHVTSAGVREAAIVELGRVFRGSQWKQLGWDLLGGTAGIAEIFDRLSVKEVRSMCKAIAQCLRIDSNNRHGSSEVFACVEELLHALDVDHPSKRPLLFQLAPLLPICRDESLILRFLSALDSEEKRRLLHRLARAHPNLLRCVAVGSVSVSVELDLRKEIIECSTIALVAAREPYMPTHAENAVPGMFPGMAFMLDLMSQLEQNKSLRPEGLDSFTNSMEYTLRRAAKRKTPFSYILQFLQRCIPLYAILYRPCAHKSIPMELIRCWSIARFGSTGTQAKFVMNRLAHWQHASRPRAEHSEALEALLVDFLGRRTDGPFDKLESDLMMEGARDTILREIAPQGRMPFLTLLFRHVVDFEVWPPSKRERSLLSPLDMRFFGLFSAGDAKKLFDRSRFRDPDEGSTLDNMTVSDDVFEIESVLRARCEAQDMESTFASTRAVIRDIQQRSEKSKDGSDRCKWACLSVRVALACHSLDILHEVIRWSRRFTRDPSTIPSLLGDTLFNRNVAEVLACTEIPPSRKPKTMSALRDLIAEANKVLETLLDILLAAVSQPVGLTRTTDQVSVLFREIATYRMEGLKKYRRDRLGSEAELAEALLDTLTPTILEYERVAIVSEDPKAKWSLETGLLSDLDCPPEPSLTAVLYLDRLAKERDSLWQQEREKKNIFVASLGSGWPRGLAIQHLLPSFKWTKCILDMTCTEQEPYVRGRVYRVLFEPDAVQDAKEKDEKAAGVFVDSLAFAAYSYVDGHNRKETRMRALRLWTFYEQMLISYPAQRDIFRHWLATLFDKMETSHSLSICRAINPPPVPNISYLDALDSPTDRAVKWDPSQDADLDDSGDSDDSDGSEPLPQRPRSLLQCRAQAKNLLSVKNFDWEKPKKPDPRWVWALKCGSYSAEDIAKPSLQTREAASLSALLFLDTLTLSPQNILSRAYPSPSLSDASRYPSIYLDDDFVASLQDDLMGSMQAATQALKATISTVPSRLLCDLVVSYLDALSTMATSSESYSLLQQCTFDLIKFFPLSDRPELAVDVVLRVLQDYPDLSSYHRHMRLSSLTKRLSPYSAKALLTKFTDFVCERLRLPPPPPQQQQQQQTKEKPSPRVKVTTAKQLAELLRHADVLPLMDCLQALESLFKATTQSDILCAVVSSWLDMIACASHNDSRAGEEIYRRFTTCAATAAAVPDETLQSDSNNGSDIRTTRQEENKLPQVSLERPLLQALVVSARHRLPENLRHRYLADTLLPVIDSLSIQNRRWVESLLSRVNLTPEEVGIATDMPFKPDIISLIMRHWSHYLPVSFLARDRLVNMSYISHKAMDRTTKALVNTDRDFLQTNAGKHWSAFLSILRNGSPFSTLEMRLRERIRRWRDPGELSVAVLSEEYCIRAPMVARHPVEFNDELNRFVVSTDVLIEGLEDLQYVQDIAHENQEDDMVNQVAELIKRIVGEVESVRSTRNNNKDTDPIILPPSLEMKTFLLPSPKYNLKGFANGLANLIRTVSTDPINLIEWECIKRTLNRIPWKSRRECGVLIGKKATDYDDENGLCYALHVKAAHYLLEDVKDEERLSDGDVLAMLEIWLNADIEYVRRIGWELRCAVP